MLIKVAKLGTAVKEVCLDESATVEDALEAADVRVGSSETMKVDGEPAENDTVLEDGDVITIVPAIKGGSGVRKMVKVAKLGSAVREFFIENGHTVSDVLDMASISPGSGEKVRVNGADVPTSTVVQDGDVVTVVPAIKGGRRC